MEQRQPPNFERLADYLAGTCTAEERADIERWRQAHPDNERMVRQLERVCEGIRIRTERFDYSAVINAVRAHVASERTHGAQSPRRGLFPRHQRRSRGAWIGLAAAAVVLIGGVAVLHDRLPTFSAEKSYTYATNVGQRTTVKLSDGSTIVLAPQTTLTVTGRAVTLLGEAYFTVAHASGTPFTVQTGSVVTRVLGTSFDVRRYASDTATRVVVTAGKVVAGAPHHSSLTLIAGSVGHVTDSTAILTPTNDASAMTDWVSGNLSFRNSPASDVLTQLGRWYGVDFRLADSTKSQESVTTTINFADTKDVVFAIENLLDVTASSSDSANGRQVIILTPNKPISRAAPARTRLKFQNLTPVGTGR